MLEYILNKKCCCRNKSDFVFLGRLVKQIYHLNKKINSSNILISHLIAQMKRLDALKTTHAINIFVVVIFLLEGETTQKVCSFLYFSF